MSLHRPHISIAVLASGRGSNFRSVADDLAGPDAPGHIELLLSDNPEAPALDEAKRRGIRSEWIDCGPRRARISEEAQDRFLSLFEEHEIGLVVCAGFMRILPRRLVSTMADRILNIHPSLLPSFPGLDAQGQAWRHGVRFSGCTVHFVDEGTDTGPIVLQAAVPVMETDDTDALTKRILAEEHKIYPRAVRLFCEGRLRVEGRRVHLMDPEDDSR